VWRLVTHSLAPLFLLLTHWYIKKNHKDFITLCIYWMTLIRSKLGKRYLRNTCAKRMWVINEGVYVYMLCEKEAIIFWSLSESLPPNLVYIKKTSDDSRASATQETFSKLTCISLYYYSLSSTRCHLKAIFEGK
jgi:hypothetical protein